jgi:hypothetical protein
MDTGKLIGEVTRRHQVVLGRDDPVLVMATVSEMAMEPTVERMETIAREVQATVAQCAGLVRGIRGAVPGITREVGDRFLDHHTHYTTACHPSDGLDLHRDRIGVWCIVRFGRLGVALSSRTAGASRDRQLRRRAATAG